jgi:hypothetical protein
MRRPQHFCVCKGATRLPLLRLGMLLMCNLVLYMAGALCCLQHHEPAHTPSRWDAQIVEVRVVGQAWARGVGALLAVGGEGSVSTRHPVGVWCT